MSKVIQETVYTIDELREQFPEVYKRVLEKHSYINVEHDWYDCIEYDFIEQLEKIGFYNIQIQFSGFYSQGDGASFSGKWYKNNVDLSKVDIEELYSDKIKQLYYTLLDLSNSCADGSFNIYRSGFYYHENTMRIESEFIDEDDELVPYDEGMILRECRTIAVELYRSLEKDYEYLTSESAILETLQCNEYFFDLSGNIRR